MSISSFLEGWVKLSKTFEECRKNFIEMNLFDKEYISYDDYLKLHNEEQAEYKLEAGKGY